MLSFANPTLPEFSDDLLIAPAVVALQGHHGKPNTFSSYTTRRDTAFVHSQIAQKAEWSNDFYVVTTGRSPTPVNSSHCDGFWPVVA